MHNHHDEAELTRKIRAAIRRDPHVLAICELLGVSVNEFLDGLGPVNAAEVLAGLDPDARELGADLIASAAELRAEAAREALLEDLVDVDSFDHCARARAAVGA
jgi:hypothetical protein